MTNEKLEAVEALALAKGLNEKALKEIRNSVEAGDHAVDFTVRVRGGVKVQEDHEAKSVAKVPWQRVATLLFEKLNGVTIESVLAEVMDEARELDEKSLKDSADEAMAKLKGSTSGTRKGAVKPSVEFTVESRGEEA